MMKSLRYIFFFFCTSFGALSRRNPFVYKEITHIVGQGVYGDMCAVHVIREQGKIRIEKKPFNLDKLKG